MQKLRDISIKKKIIVIILSIILVTILPVSIMFSAYQIKEYRRNTEVNVKTIAEFLGSNSVSALFFDDRDTARSNLRLLESQPHIIAAFILKKDMSVLAGYLKKESRIRTNHEELESLFSKTGADTVLVDRLLHVKSEIKQDSEKIGTLYITADLQEFYDEMAFNLLIQIAVFSAIFVLSYVLAYYFQRIITNPVMDLLWLTRRVAETKNYRLRATKHGNDETGLLIDGFNDMLREIETKDRELKIYANDLEELVGRRTLEINNKNIKLRKAIDALKIAKDQAIAGSMAKSSFLANMSHELRTPLNHIIGFTELLYDEHFGMLNESQKEYLADVLDSSRHLLILINDILDLSKIEAGKMELNISEICVNDFLNEAMGIIREKCYARRIRLALDTENAPVIIEADVVKLRQIIYNLLGNAAKFTHDDGRIKLIARTVKMNENERHNESVRYLRITVSDTGIGLRQEDLYRIFSPFEQADGTSSRVFQGTGLGLSLTQKLVELHDGKIWAESMGQDMGSSFHVVLPVKSSRDKFDAA